MSVGSNVTAFMIRTEMTATVHLILNVLLREQDKT